MGVDAQGAYARGAIACALAPFDIERALALIEPITSPEEHDRYTGSVASAIVESDPARATALASGLPGESFTPQRIKAALAYAVADKNPDEALRIIDGMSKGSAPAKFQAEGLGWVAEVLVASDGPRAYSLVDRALAIPIDGPEEFASWINFGGGAATSAWIATSARRAGYPDMESVIGRVLASRVCNGSRITGREICSEPIGAIVLSLTDPRAARQLLRDLERRSGLSAVALNKAAGERWLAAWALVDQAHAERLFEAELIDLASARDVNLHARGLLKMAEVLTIPRHRREAFFRKQFGPAWYPGVE